MLTEQRLEDARRELLVRRLLVVFSSLRNRLFSDLEAAGFPGITMQHSLVLRQMHLAGATVADVARAAGVSRQAIATIARDLARRGYVAMDAHPTDGRKLVLRFTRRGRQLAEASIACAARLDGEVDDVLGRHAKGFRAAMELLEARFVREDVQEEAE